jgi:hypothetical protein
MRWQNDMGQEEANLGDVSLLIACVFVADNRVSTFVRLSCGE